MSHGASGTGTSEPALGAECLRGGGACAYLLPASDEPDGGVAVSFRDNASFMLVSPPASTRASAAEPAVQRAAGDDRHGVSTRSRQAHHALAPGAGATTDGLHQTAFIRTHARTHTHTHTHTHTLHTHTQYTHSLVATGATLHINVE